MIVIFGFGHKTSTDKELRDRAHCYRCNNTSQWKLSKTKTWATLFFIPVVPVKTEYRRYCPICREGIKINQDEYLNQLNNTI